MLSQQEFINAYCEASGVTWEWLGATEEAVPCECGADGCLGWAMVLRGAKSPST